MRTTQPVIVRSDPPDIARQGRCERAERVVGCGAEPFGYAQSKLRRSKQSLSGLGIACLFALLKVYELRSQ